LGKRADEKAVTVAFKLSRQLAAARWADLLQAAAATLG
jgi:hypothetical protein